VTQDRGPSDHDDEFSVSTKGGAFLDNFPEKACAPFFYIRTVSVAGRCVPAGELAN